MASKKVVIVEAVYSEGPPKTSLTRKDSTPKEQLAWIEQKIAQLEGRQPSKAIVDPKQPNCRQVECIRIVP